MKSLSCKDMGSATCNFVATGMTEDEVIGTMMQHATVTHPQDMEKMKAMPKDQMMAMMKSKIKEM